MNVEYSAGMHPSDVSLLVLRVAIGVVFVAHGYNHIFRAGKIAGTARWFESLGMRPGVVHAWFASLTELGAGALLVVGFATPLACAGVIGTMLVAWVTNHLHNGFFIFRPGEGYEYVMTLTLVAVGVAGAGPGRWSLDRAVGWFDALNWAWFALAVGGGALGATVLLAVFWRRADGTTM